MNYYRKVAIYSIQSHPIDDYHFCVGGRDSFVRSYDRRNIRSDTQTPMRSFCPSHLVIIFVLLSTQIDQTIIQFLGFRLIHQFGLTLRQLYTIIMDQKS